MGASSLSERLPEGSRFAVLASGSGTNLQALLDAYPDNVADLTQAALEEINRLQRDGPSVENLEKVRETHLRNYERSLKEDSFWLNNLSYYREHELPLDGVLKVPERAKALTPEKVRDATRKYFSSDNMLNARLLPEAKPSASGK